MRWCVYPPLIIISSVVVQCMWVGIESVLCIRILCGMAKVSKALMADGLTIAYQEWGRGKSLTRFFCSSSLRNLRGIEESSCLAWLDG